MKPSPEAIEAAIRTAALDFEPWVPDSEVRRVFTDGLDAAYAVDMPNVERPLIDALRKLVRDEDNAIASGPWLVAEIQSLIAQHSSEEKLVPESEQPVLQRVDPWWRGGTHE